MTCPEMCCQKNYGKQASEESKILYRLLAQVEYVAPNADSRDANPSKT